jgi:hypothetical protein
MSGERLCMFGTAALSGRKVCLGIVGAAASTSTAHSLAAQRPVEHRLRTTTAHGLQDRAVQPLRLMALS